MVCAILLVLMEKVEAIINHDDKHVILMDIRTQTAVSLFVDRLKDTADLSPSLQTALSVMEKYLLLSADEKKDTS